VLKHITRSIIQSLYRKSWRTVRFKIITRKFRTRVERTIETDWTIVWTGDCVSGWKTAKATDQLNFLFHTTLTCPLNFSSEGGNRSSSRKVALLTILQMYKSINATDLAATRHTGSERNKKWTVNHYFQLCVGEGEGGRNECYEAQPSCYYMYQQVQHSTIPRSAHTVYLCVLYGSANKQRLLPYTALTDWFSQPRRRMFTAWYGLNI